MLVTYRDITPHKWKIELRQGPVCVTLVPREPTHSQHLSISTYLLENINLHREVTQQHHRIKILAEGPSARHPARRVKVLRQGVGLYCMQSNLNELGG